MDLLVNPTIEIPKCLFGPLSSVRMGFHQRPFHGWHTGPLKYHQSLQNSSRGKEDGPGYAECAAARPVQALGSPVAIVVFGALIRLKETRFRTRERLNE